MANAALDARPTTSRPRVSLSVLAVVVALAAVTAGADDGVVVRESGRRVLVVAGGDVGTRLRLPDRFVVAGTDTVRVDGVLLSRGVDYELSDDADALVLANVPSDSSVVLISYLYLPYDLEDSYARAVLDSVAGPPPWVEGEERLVATGQADGRDLPSGLRVGGAKTFGIKVGSGRDPTLEQSLRLNVSGQITRDLKVNAYLSDQNTPLVPEGDTEELRALDRVLLEIEGENLSASMGDVELALRGGRLFDVRRELKGATAEASFGSAGLALAGAAADGEFTTHTFRGVEGKQGPYLLTGDGGETGVQVVAGSERVWVDGERRSRGRDNDYVVDYTSGELTFTEHLRITSDNVITVDYEYSLSDYERDIYAGRATFDLGGVGTVGASFFREADDKGSPVATALGEEQVAILQAAGDAVDLAHDAGVDSVGVGGDYVLAAEGHFEYVGDGAGEYDLHFERRENGDYEYDLESDGYVYVGDGEGDYALGRSLPLPSDLIFGAVDAAVRLPGDGSLEVEGAVSSVDMNTFSDLDDDDNLGNAQIASVGLPRLRFGESGRGRVALDVIARRVAGAFRGVSRYRDVRYLEKWELEGLSLPDQELLFEGTGAVEMEGLGNLRVSYGRLERGDDVTSEKAEFHVDGARGAGTRLSVEGRLVELESIEESREREFLKAAIEHDLGPVAPGVSYRHDSRVSSATVDERYDEYGASLRRAGGAFGLGARYAHRLTDRRDDAGWNRASTTRTQEYSLQLRQSEKLAVEASASRRITDFEPGIDRSDTKHDVATLRANHRSMDDALKGEFRYSVTSTEVEERIRYVTVEDGVETIRTLSTGEYYPVTELSASTRWQWGLRPGLTRARELPEPSAVRRFLSALSLEVDLRLTEMTTADDKLRLYLLDPSVVQGEDTVRGEMTGRYVARYVARDGTRSLRLAVTTRDALDRSYIGSSERGKERAGTADLKLSPSGGVAYRLQGDLGRRSRDSVGTGYSYEIDERSALGEVTVRRLGDLEAGLAAALYSATENVEGIDVTRTTVTPSVKYRLRGRGTASVSFSRIDLSSSAETLPIYLEGGRRPGLSTEWRAAADYRLNRYLTASLSYTGEKRSESDARHTLDVRVNAYF